MPRKKALPADVFSDTIMECYPEEIVHLKYDPANPWTLVFAVMLSAQCTDARVNMTTPQLFNSFPDLESFVAKPVEMIEQQIKSITFFRNKAKAMKGSAELLLLHHNGQIPNTLEELIKLPGVGRKTANVVLSVLFGINEGFVVDTHIKRIAFRTGLTRHTDPVKVEPDLMKKLPQKLWGSLSHKLVQFGRDVCDARKPKCETCPFATNCPRHGVEKKS